MSLPKTLALLTFFISFLGLGAVNMALDPMDSEGVPLWVTLGWALILSFGVGGVAWAVQSLVVPLGSDRYWTRRRSLAVAVLCLLVLGIIPWLPAELQRRQVKDFGASAEFLRQVYGDFEGPGRTEVVAAIARHGNAPSDVLADLAQSEDPALDHPRWNLMAVWTGNARSLRELVAGHPSPPPEALARLADLSGQRGLRPVLSVLASNPRCPASLLTRLAGHESLEVLGPVVHHPDLPTEDLERLAGHTEAQIRRGVGAHPRTPPEVLERLAKDAVIQVRWSVASNPSVPLQLLGRLLNDPNEEVRLAAQAAREKLLQPVRVHPRLGSHGYLTFPVSDIESLREWVDRPIYPMSQELFWEAIGVPSWLLERGFGVSATSVWTQMYNLTGECHLATHILFEVETDALIGAEIRCSGNIWPERPKALESHANLERALASIGMAEEPLLRLARCKAFSSESMPWTIECFQVDSENDLLIEKAASGVRAVQVERSSVRQ